MNPSKVLFYGYVTPFIQSAQHGDEQCEYFAAHHDTSFWTNGDIEFTHTDALGVAAQCGQCAITVLKTKYTHARLGGQRITN